jgi:hypothetical protein
MHFLTNEKLPINDSGNVSTTAMDKEMEEVLRLWKIEETDSEFSLYDFTQIVNATRNFSDDTKLGEGGFGPVYRVRQTLFRITRMVIRNTLIVTTY